MRQGFELYFRAIAQLFSNLRAVLWATGPAWLMLTILTSLAAFMIVGETASAADGGDVSPGFSLPPYFWTYFMVAQCLSFMTVGYIGPKLHRTILPEDTSKIALPYSDYLFGLMQMGLIGVGLAFLASRLISLISATLPGPLGYLTLPVVCMLAILYVLLRVSVILPAIAVGRPRTMRQAWSSTAPFRYPLALSLVLLVVTIAGLHSLALLLASYPWLSLALGAVASWLALMILLSYLNVIYRTARWHEIRMTRRA